MIYLRRVVGTSMLPTLREGQIIIVSNTRHYKKQDVVVAILNRKEVIKRITDIANGKVFLEGDNSSRSTDSRTYGWIVDSRILGKVIWPRTTMQKG